MNSLIYRGSTVRGSSRGSLNLFKKELEYHFSTIQSRYHTPDDATLIFTFEGAIRDVGIQIFITIGSTYTHRIHHVKITYSDNRIMTDRIQNDILNMLASYGLNLLYSKEPVEIAMEP